MSAPTGVLVVTQESQTAQAVAKAVNFHEHIVSQGVCKNLDDLLMTLDRSYAPAVVVDIDPKPGQILSELDQIINRFSGTRFIVLASEQRPELVMQAMQVGVRHFMLKGNISSELPGVLQRLLPNTGTRNGFHGAHGSIVTILSAGGGSGATTLAINLANELHLLTSEATLLIDLDCNSGGAAGYLGVNAQYGIADVLSDGDRIDSQLIKTTAVPHNDHFHVLASPATVDFENPRIPQFEYLSRALQKGKDAYGFTVVDAPHVLMDVAAQLGRASIMTYLLLELNVEHIRVARAIYAAITSRGVAADRVLPLANRYRGRREMITLAEAQRAIGCTQIGQLSNDYKAVLSSVNYGKPLAENSPRSELRLDIQKLAKAIHESVGRQKRAVV
jgi:pilus assembly protein CpaE